MVSLTVYQTLACVPNCCAWFFVCLDLIMICMYTKYIKHQQLTKTNTVCIRYCNDVI